MSATPIGLSNDQIKEIIRLVTQDMNTHLGYDVHIIDTSKKGEDINLRMYDLRDEHYTIAVQKVFDDSCYARLCEVAKIHGEGG